MHAALRNVLNFAGFYAGWFACVLLGGAQGREGLALALVAGLLLLHLALAPRRFREASMIGFVALGGYLAECVVVASGAYAFTGAEAAHLGAPLWVLALWALFASTLNASLAWMRGRAALAALFGAVGGPLSFYAAARMGAVSLALPGYLVVGILWAVAMPILLALQERWFAEDGLMASLASPATAPAPAE